MKSSYFCLEEVKDCVPQQMQSLIILLSFCNFPGGGLVTLLHKSLANEVP